MTRRCSCGDPSHVPRSAVGFFFGDYFWVVILAVFAAAVVLAWVF